MTAVTSPFALEGSELRLAARFGFTIGDSIRYGRIALVLLAVCWLPLLVLAIVDGSAYGHPPAIPLLGDYLAFGRFFIALPLLVLLHPIVDRQVAIALSTLRHSGLAAGDAEGEVDRHLGRAKALWQSPVIRLILLGVSFVAAFAALPAKSLQTVSSWAFAGEPGEANLTRAGWWSLFIAGPLVRFLVLMAVWKLLIWWAFLLRLARTPLHYEPLHPDRCAGLGFLDRVQVGFSVLAAALGIQVGCLIADAVAYQGVELESFKALVAAFAVLMLTLLFTPLLAFMPALLRACERTETGFHAWAGHASRRVGANLRATSDASAASQLESPEISTLTDATALFEATVRTRRIPISRRSLVTVLAASALPIFVPLLPLLPLKELAKRLAGIIL